MLSLPCRVSLHKVFRFFSRMTSEFHLPSLLESIHITHILSKHFYLTRPTKASICLPRYAWQTSVCRTELSRLHHLHFQNMKIQVYILSISISHFFLVSSLVFCSQQPLPTHTHSLKNYLIIIICSINIKVYHDFPDPGVIPRGYKYECQITSGKI